MIRFGMIGMLLMTVSAVQVSAQADSSSFAIFEHRPTPVAPEAVEPVLPAQGEANLSLSKVAFAPSFREVIYLASVREAELRYGLPTGLLQALIWTESRFNPMAISPAGAAGLAQLMPGTARYLGITNRHDPVASIDGGARYLREMLDSRKDHTCGKVLGCAHERRAWPAPERANRAQNDGSQRDQGVRNRQHRSVPLRAIVAEGEESQGIEDHHQRGAFVHGNRRANAEAEDCRGNQQRHNP